MINKRWENTRSPWPGHPKKNIFPEAWFLASRPKGDKPICQPYSELAQIAVAGFSQMSPLENYLLHLCFIELPTTKEKRTISL